ncbi:MAG: YncE family protein [Thermoplasmata archaeon]|nr:YncE family protein [Thermoplasmata archaeon]
MTDFVARSGRAGARSGVRAPSARFAVVAAVGLLLLGSALLVSIPATSTHRFASLSHLLYDRPHDPPAAAPAGVGTVVDTLELTTNRLLPGNQQLPVQSDPQMVLFDPATGNFYVRGGAGETLTVVNASTDTVLTALTIGYGGSAYIPNVPTMAIDSTTGYLYETNPSASTVGVVQTSTNTLVANVSVGGSPGGIVFDPSSGNLYTSNWVNGTVSVISGSTNTVVATIPVGGEAGAILYDSVDQEVFVSNFNKGNVSVIDTSTETVVANPVTGIASGEPVALALDSQDDLVSVVNSLTDNVTVINGTTNAAMTSVGVGTVPTSATYAPSTDTLLVANGASNNITVLQQPAETILATIAIGHGAQGAAEDPVSGDIYIADYGANSVAVVDPANNSLIATVTTNNFPEDLGVDTSSGNVYVGNEGTSQVDSNLTVISGSSGTSVASIPLVVYPTSLTAAPNGKVYAVDHGGVGAFIIPETTNREGGYAPSASPGPVVSAYDTATGDLWIASAGTGTVNVVTASGSPVATLELGFDTDGLAYDAGNGRIYVSNYYSGNVTIVNGATETVVSVLTVAAFNSLGAEIYDPVDHAVYVADYSYHNVTVVNGASTNGSIQVGSDPTSFAYDPENGTIFVANYGSNNISVINALTNQVTGSIGGYFPEYLAYDAATNALYVSTSENGEVDAVNATTYASLGTPLLIQDSIDSGGIAYGATSQEIYVANTYDSSISILSSSAAPTNATYPVTFVESGLVGSPTWEVTLGSVPNSSSTNQIGFVEPNGTYGFVVGTVPGYVVNVSSGDVTVLGASKTVDLGFTAAMGGGGGSYPVQFNESGLLQGTPWGVSLSPSGATGASTADAPSPIVFEAPNASYTFTVHAVTGYTSAPGTGTVAVAGQPRYQTIDFTAVPSPLTATLAVAPAEVTLGATSTLTTTASGGSPSYSYSYSGLPAGCASDNSATVQCTPTVTGTFAITVNVTDSAKLTVEAHATLQVIPPVSTNISPSGSSNWVWEIVGGLVILFALLLLFVWWRRRKKAEPALPPTPGPATSIPAPPPSGPS